MPFRTNPNLQAEAVESLKQLRSELNGCSDDLTQIHTPGPIEFLEGNSPTGTYVRIVYIYVWMFTFVVYAIYVGIIKHIVHYMNKGKETVIV